MRQTVGGRIRQLRERHGWTQQQLAAALPVSASYLSLIESGRRRPQQRVVEKIAARLGCTVDYLLTGRGGPDNADLELELRFAELALGNGDQTAALERFRALVDTAARVGHEDIAHDARWGLSRAHIAIGDHESAIEIMESLAAEPELKGMVSRVRLADHLAHAYLECGEVTRAIEVAEAALAANADEPTDPDEAVELAATLVYGYYCRGDLVRASLLIRRVIADAERRDSTRSRAAAYWNAGLVAEARGDLRAGKVYAERALALYGELDNQRATAILRINCAGIMLRIDPDLAAAEDLLMRALAHLSTEGTPVDVAIAETELARCHLLGGRLDEARAETLAALTRLGDGQRLEAANATVMLARIELAAGRIDEAMSAYAEAARRLSSVEASREAAALWRELGEQLLTLGRNDEALTAYRRAADGAGLVDLLLGPVTARSPKTSPSPG